MFVSAFVVPARSPRFLPSFVSHCHRLLFFTAITLRIQTVDACSFFLPTHLCFNRRFVRVSRGFIGVVSPLVRFEGFLTSVIDMCARARVCVCTVDVDLRDFLGGIYFFFFLFFHLLVLPYNSPFPSVTPPDGIIITFSTRNEGGAF